MNTKLLFLFTLFFSSATSVYAEIVKNYNQSGCRADYHEGKLEMSWGVGSLKNFSTTEKITVFCPIIKESIRGNLQSAWVEVIDNNYLDDVHCFLHSYGSGEDGKPGYAISQHRRTKGASYQIQKLVFSSMESRPNGAYSLECTIPPQNSDSQGASSIYTYSVTEQ